MDIIEAEKAAAIHAKHRPYKWCDVTQQYKEAVKDLLLGELLNDEMFGLFEAMSAIEMMDPKMDAGMVCNRGVRKAKSFDHASKTGMLKVEDFTCEELIAIIDTTLACIVSWLEGNSMAQTVFTNLYLHHPYGIGDKTLKTFCFIVYKVVETIKEFIHKAMVYEEEDFQPMQYGYALKPDISDHRVIGMLREVEEDLHRKSRSKQIEIHALYARIKFMRVFYQALLTLRREDLQQSIPECQKFLSTASECLLEIKKTVRLGKPSEDDESMFYGFEPLVNQRLLPPTFPRYTKIKTRMEGLMYFEYMIERFKAVCKIQNINYFHQALEFFIDFSKTSPCILSRSALQLLYPGTNQNNCKDILREAVKTFISPPALVSKSIMSNSQAKHNIDTFLTRCSRPFANLLQLCGHNRARQRDKLANLLEEFVTMQDEAERIDAYLHTLTVKSTIARPHLACFGTWILYHTLKIMIMYLLAGFELELYSVHEYYYIYWYLYEFLYGWLVSALSRADSFLVENELLNELQKTKSNKKKPKNKKKLRPYSRDIFYYQALQNICGGYYKALMGFRLDGKLAVPDDMFDNEQVRYEHRFAPFQSFLTPPPVQYSEFRDMTAVERFQQQPVDSVYLYMTACKHFHQARQLLESIVPDDEVVNLLKIVKTNFVVMKLLAGGHKKDSSSPPEFDFSLHRHFAIIKLN